MNPAYTPDGSQPVALVTGASSGIGRAFAEQLAARGFDLVVVARRRDRLEELAGELRSGGRSVEVLAADLTEPSQLAAVEQRLREGVPPVEVLVNNAGFGTRGLFASTPLDHEDREVRLNVLAPVRLTHAALQPMLEHGSGAVVNVSSLAGLQPIPFWAIYAATKSFLTSFTVAVHEEVRHRGVRVLAVLPGFTHSEFHHRTGGQASVAPAGLWMDPHRVVASALRDLDRGRATSVPGLGYRLFATATRVIPWTLSRKVVRRSEGHSSSTRR